MGLSCRLFLLDPDDGLYRLPNTRFDPLLRDPACPGLPRFAGFRVRTANVVVECLDRQPLRRPMRTVETIADADPSYRGSSPRAAEMHTPIDRPDPPPLPNAPILDEDLSRRPRYFPT